ncbi:unnamed protein product [Oncorhynchus mykiss]|uniref:Uncharacterized protein n=1 Tax=Oncorhynchus mykiss TaxID=8022 RepID=A0A060YHW6_ONCMY|nr:unnamed protein product [Oncorhynchus mykiss]
MTQNTEVNQQLNGFNRRKYAFWSGPVRVLTSTRLRCFGMTLRVVHTVHPKNIAELKQFCKEEWSKIPPDRCAGLICNYRKCLVEVIAAKGVSTSY